MNNNEIDIKVIAKDLASATLKEVKNQVAGMSDEVDNASAKGSILTGVVTGLTTAITTFGIGIITSGIEKFTNFFGDAINSASEFQKQMISLDIISERFGVSGKDAQKSAEQLGKELKIGVGPAAESLQNLLKSGLNLNQATDLMKRFYNEALTGKSESISLAQAVQNLSFAYTTNNSALGNLSGISENFGVITEKGKQSLIDQGMAISDITDEMAKYQGMIDLTNLTMGSAEKLTDSYANQQAILNYNFEEFRRKIGTALLPVMSEFLNSLNQIWEEAGPKITELFETSFKQFGELLIEIIVPKVKEFINYLGSEQFKKDLEHIRDIFKDVKELIVEAWELVKHLGDEFRLFQKNLDSISKGFTIGFKSTMPIPRYAEGGDFITNSPRLIMVGDNPGNRERVQITPLSSPNYDPKSNAQIVNNFYGYDATQISETINNQIKFGY